MNRLKKLVMGFHLGTRLAILMAFLLVTPFLYTTPAAATPLILTSPVGGETWGIGTTKNITWNYQGSVGLISWVDLDYSTDSGATWTPIKHGLGLSPAQYAWTVPNKPTTHAQIKITVSYQTLTGTFPPVAKTLVGGTDLSGSFTIAKLIIPVSLATPVNLSATAASSSQINLAWTDKSNNETGFSIERKTGSGSYTEITKVAANTVTYSDSNLSSGTAYTYRVKAIGNGGNIFSSGYSNEAGATTKYVIVIPIFLAAPVNLSATAASSSQINLAWTDKSNNETGFSIERKTGSGSYAEITKVAANTVTYSDSNLSSGTAYTYRVKAIGNGGNIHNSSYSNEASATTSGTVDINPPKPPADGQTVLLFYIGNSDYYVKNQVQSMDTAPIISGGRTLLPIRYVATPLGASVEWNRAEQKVTVTLNGKIIELWIGQSTARVNGVAVPIDPNNPNVTPIVVPPGRTMLPLRFIAENLGCQVDWNQSLQMVSVTYPKP